MPEPIGFSKPLGGQIPETRHAISVSLPTWDDVVAFADKDPRVMCTLKGGYPRFVLHRDLLAVSKLCLESSTNRDLGLPVDAPVGARSGINCLVFPSIAYATDCQEYIIPRSVAATANQQQQQVIVRRIDFAIEWATNKIPGADEGPMWETIDLYAVFYPMEHHDLARRFWRITGTGISSRLAEDVLKGMTKFGATRVETFDRYNRELSGWSPHRIIQRRILSLQQKGVSMPPQPLGDSSRIGQIVYLYPTGMAAIYSLTKMLRSWRGTNAVVFGFPYDSTLRVHEAFAKDHLFYGHGNTDELDQLDAHLENVKSVHNRTIQYVWCECTSNPLVRTPDLDRIRDLADKYGFLVIVDDTIGTMANTNVLNVADIIVTSLSKSFNGRADAMGGSIVLNRLQQRHHGQLRRHFSEPQNTRYTDSSLLYHRDAQQIEHNSRNYLSRMSRMNRNAARLVDMLTPLAGPDRALKCIYYPRDDPHYRGRMRQQTLGDGFVPGYGGLFTLVFASVGLARAFFDALDVCKGSSLGAEMTLAQPYVQTVFPRKKEWAAQYGLDEAIVRCSMGVEDVDVLKRVFGLAMEAAEKAFTGSPCANARH
ncbi:cystathionine gamma-synthase [Apiospora rasikravindrae]|uniref:Cystathionine gamma-synthase n=1 Tax=Apiospora rasikravindrae TaxID=990691 RepID=A0ABR1TW53_9PEZI